MNETVCRFGPDQSLFGILSQPAPQNRVSGAPVAIILNAGIVHRVGPFRLHVDLARRLAQHGFSTLRMDLSGLGDSLPRTGKVEIKNRAQSDVKDALDYLSATMGANKFVVLGLCSGAFNAHNVSISDERVVGSVFMDGIVFRTVGFYIRRFINRYLNPRFWRNAIKRRMSPIPTANETSGDKLGESEFFGEDLSQDQVIKDLKQLYDRGVQMLFVYTDGYDDICGRSQFQEMYGMQPDKGQLQVEYYPKSEHTFRLTENRDIACDRIVNWYQGRFATSG